MRYALISDIHANRQALSTVLTDIRSIGIDEIICLGDIVGYGPCPAETLETAYTKIRHFVLGNHDAVAAGLIKPDNFHNQAKKLINWTKSQLDPKAVNFLKSFPMVLEGEDFACVHSNFVSPGAFDYIDTTADADKSFNSNKMDLLFIGHSHVPAIFAKNDVKSKLFTKVQDFSIENEVRYIINVGSVGQPRDGDIRASYCIYDSEKQDIIFRKLPFDIDAFRQDTKINKMTEKASYFLFVSDSNIQADVRMRQDFSPLQEDQAVNSQKNVETMEEQLKNLQSSQKKLIISLILAFIIIAGLAIGWIFLKKENKESVYTVKASAEKLKFSSKSNELAPAPSISKNIDINTPLKYWSLTFSDPEKQKITVTEEEQEKVFLVSSEIKEAIVIQLLPIKVKRGERYSASAQFENNSVKSGFAEISFDFKNKNGIQTTILRREPKGLFPPEKRWKPTSITISKNEVLRNNGKLFFTIKLNFKGKLKIRKCSLERK